MASKLDTLQVSGSVQNDFKCEWIVERFSLLDSKVGEFHQSPIFQLCKEGIPFYLKLFPGGQTEKSEGYVSLFCYTKKDVQHQDEKVKMCLSLKNTNGQILYEANDVEFRQFMAHGFGYAKTREISYITSRLYDDTLVVDFRVTHKITCSKDNTEIHRCKESPPSQKVTDDFKNLWASKENTDFVISVGGDEIPVHSIILGARSKVFSAMLKHDVTERNTHRLEVTDFEKDTMESLMEFLYSGEVNDMSFDQALELLRASDKYEVSDLKSYCDNYLTSVLNDENVCRVLVAADMYNAEKLRIQAMRQFFVSLPKIDFQAERSILKVRPELLCDLLEKMSEYKKTEQLRPDLQGNSGNKRRRTDACYVNFIDLSEVEPWFF